MADTLVTNIWFCSEHGERRDSRCDTCAAGMRLTIGCPPPSDEPITEHEYPSRRPAPMPEPQTCIPEVPNE
jgi:hypothetical protein